MAETLACRSPWRYETVTSGPCAGDQAQFLGVKNALVPTLTVK